MENTKKPEGWDIMDISTFVLKYKQLKVTDIIKSKKF